MIRRDWGERVVQRGVLGGNAALRLVVHDPGAVGDARDQGNQQLGRDGSGGLPEVGEKQN